MESISLSAARADLKAVMDRVVADRVPMAITRRRGEGVVLVSASEWESIEETLYLFAVAEECRAVVGNGARIRTG